MESASQLLDIAFEALDACAPDNRVRTVLSQMGEDSGRFDLLAIGKCAGKMMDGARTGSRAGRALTIIPRGYPPPSSGIVMEGEHPLPGAGSFAAGAAALEFVRSSTRPVLLLLSGGGSACAELPADGIDAHELRDAWVELLRSGLPIARINRVRRHLSAIKGGRLGHMMPSGSLVLIHSDVPRGRERDVASSPAFGSDPETDARELEAALAGLGPRMRSIVARVKKDIVQADHRWQVTADATLLLDETGRLLDAHGWTTRSLGADSLDDAVDVVARRLVDELADMDERHVSIASGEPHVPVRGDGAGGRCSELAARLALEAMGRGARVDGVALATDGVDGSSGTAGTLLHGGKWEQPGELIPIIENALESSNTGSIADRIGGPVIMAPGGNNLRDLLLLAHG